MSLFAIADLHLSIGSDKPMDVFSGWQDYANRLDKCWRNLVKTTDTVVIPGDISWGIDLSEAKEDLLYIDSLPGCKVIIKGNHDYWWPTQNKMNMFFQEYGIKTIIRLYHNAVGIGDTAICGTRSWFYEEGSIDNKVYRRELQRLKMSLESAKSLELDEIISFLHYPPIFGEYIYDEFINLMVEYGVKRCYYGHLHGNSINNAFNGVYKGIQFRLTSADSLHFCPLFIK